jgi:hypothetical protein
MLETLIRALSSVDIKNNESLLKILWQFEKSLGENIFRICSNNRQNSIKISEWRFYFSAVFMENMKICKFFLISD